MNKLNLSKPEDRKDFSESSLSHRFAATETQLRDGAKSLETKPDEFQSLCQSQLDAFLTKVKPEVLGALESVQQRYDVIRHQLKEALAHKNQLIGLRRIHERYPNSNGRPPLLYLTLYLGLIGAAMAIFVCNFQLIFPDSEWWMGALSSLIVIGPSFLLGTEYLRRHDKDKFLKLIHWVGLSASILMVIAFAVARALAYMLLNSVSSTTTSIFSTSTSSSSLDKAQMIASLVAFLAAIATEIAFGGRLAISIADYRMAKHPIDKLNEGLMSVEIEIKQLEAERELLEREIAKLHQFETIASAWKQAQQQQLVLFFKETQADIQKSLLQKFGNLSAGELSRLLAIVNNLQGGT